MSMYQGHDIRSNTTLGFTWQSVRSWILAKCAFRIKIAEAIR